MDHSKGSTSQSFMLPISLPNLGVVADGFLAGAIGAASFALYFLAVDLARAEPFATPSLVGAVVLEGASLAPRSVDLGIVAAYSLVHAALFAAFGVAASWLVSRLRAVPASPLLALLCFLALEVGFLAATSVFAPGLGSTIGHGVVAGGNALAAAVVALYLRSVRAAG